MMHPQTKSEMDRMADIFKALGDRTRLHIISLLSHKELCVCEITSILKITQSNASQHLAKLRSVDLVRERRNAQWVYYSLNPETFPLILDILNKLPTTAEELDTIRNMEKNQKCDI